MRVYRLFCTDGILAPEEKNLRQFRDQQDLIVVLTGPVSRDIENFLKRECYGETDPAYGKRPEHKPH